MSEQDIKHINIELSEIIRQLKDMDIRLTIIEEKVDYLDKYKEVLLKNND